MANLYKIDGRLETLVTEEFDEETGEILDGEELTKRFDEVALELENKISNIACFIKNLNAEAEMIKAEKQNLDKRQKQAEKKAEWLKSYLDGYLKATVKEINKYKFSDARCQIGYRKSSTVEVPDLDLLDKKYIKTKTEYSADKTAIKEAIKNGESVQGASIKENLNIQIK